MGRIPKIPIKSDADLKVMRESCRITAQLLDEVGPLVRPGMSTEELNVFVHERTLALGATPSPLNYKGYPKACCISPNDVICHGIPSPYTLLLAGDIVNIDVSCYYQGFHGDSSRMYLVGGPEACTPAAGEIVATTRLALFAGIREVAPGKHVGDIGAGIQEFIKATGRSYGIVREYTGHGLGREFHEPPTVLHIGRRGTGDIMKPGMTFTIEPMINAGSYKTELSKVDGWTVRTIDGSLSAQWEHTVLVTATGHEILTLGQGEVLPAEYFAAGCRPYGTPPG